MRRAVLALTLVALAAAAPAASADDVWLWACHGPDGQPLGSAGGQASPAAECSGEAGLLARAGSSWGFGMPADTTLNEVRIRRAGTLGSGETYRLEAAQPLETSTAAEVPFDDLTFPASGERVTFGVTCDGCEAEDTGVEATALAFRVRDAEPPTGSVGGWRSPASGALTLDVVARDAGLGLKSATAYLDGVPVSTVSFGNGACGDLSPGSADIDLPYGLVGQNDNTDETPAKPVGCVRRGTQQLSVDTTRVPDGEQHTIAVTVTDFANNAATVMARTTEILNAERTVTNTQTLTIGTSGVVPVPADNGGGPGGGVAGASETSCASPQLSMRLSTKPLRIRKRVPVLLARKAYRFKGRLTCVIRGRRHSAPKRVRVRISVKAGRKTVARRRISTRARGRLKVRLRFKKSGNVRFRVAGASGRRAQVRIRFKVRKPRKLRATVHARWFRFVLPRDQVRFAMLEARRVPRRARIRVRCHGPGCPGGFRRTARPKHYRRHVSLLRGLAGVNLLPGASVTVTITKRGYRGIGKLYCIRDGQRVKARAYRLGRKHRPRC